MRKRKIIHFYANNRNIGDYFSAKGIHFALKNFVEDFSKKYEYKGVTINRPWKILDKKSQITSLISSLSNDDVILVGGGGLLHPYFTSFWKSLFLSNSANTIHLIGVGAVDYRGGKSDSLIELFRYNKSRLTRVTVRDELTSRFFKNFEIEPIKTLCPSVLYIDHARKHFLDREDEHHGSELLLVRHKEIESFGLQNNGKMVNFVELGESLQKDFKISEISNVTTFGTKFESDLMLKKYFKTSLVLSSRLHGDIIAYTLNKPLATFNYDTKILDFMKEAFEAKSHKFTNYSCTLIDFVASDQIISSLKSINSPVTYMEIIRRRKIIDELKSFYLKHLNEWF